MLDALILQDALDALDGKARTVKEVLDAFDKINIVGTVIAASTTTL